MTLDKPANIVTPEQLVRTIVSSFAASLPVMVWGPPGVGKSAIVMQIAKQMFGRQTITMVKDDKTDTYEADLEVGQYFVDIRAMLLDPVDLRGVPSVENGVTRWNPPCFLPVVGEPIPGAQNGEVFAAEGVINIDEISQCDQSVQSALLQLFLDRKLGEYVVPAGWKLVAAGNRISDGTFSKKISKALGSRFGTHVDLEVSAKDWREWAVDNGIAHEVSAFINFRPELLHQFDPKAEGHSFPCPRTWEFVSNYIGKLDTDIQLPVFAGTLGKGPAVEFISFLRLFNDLPNIDEVLINPEGTKLPNDPASQYALCGALARKTTAQSATACFKYMSRLSVEMQVVWLRDSLRLSVEVAKTPEFNDWAVKHGDLLC